MGSLRCDQNNEGEEESPDYHDTDSVSVRYVSGSKCSAAGCRLFNDVCSMFVSNVFNKSNLLLHLRFMLLLNRLFAALLT